MLGCKLDISTIMFEMISDPYLLMARFIVVPMKMARTRVQYRIAASSFLDIAGSEMGP